MYNNTFRRVMTRKGRGNIAIITSGRFNPNSYNGTLGIVSRKTRDGFGRSLYRSFLFRDVQGKGTSLNNALSREGRRPGDERE
jgi:hypothetical protein